MYLMYVDESGDPGIANSPTRYFALSGLVIHELRWRNFLDQTIAFRRRVKAQYGLGVRDEIHAAEFVGRGRNLKVPRHKRLAILRNFCDELAQMPFLSVTNVIVDKQGKPAGFDVFSIAWKTLFQRFENTLTNKNFPAPSNPDDRGLVFCDNTDGGKLTRIMRTMGAYNPIPNQSQFGMGYRNLPIQSVIEDPNLRDSQHSHFIQAADLCVYMLQQKYRPNSYIRRKSGHGYFNRLQPILNTKASAKNGFGIVEL